MWLKRQQLRFENQFIYFPERILQGNPGDHHLSYDDVEIRTEDDVSIHGWFVRPKGLNPKQTVLWFHGNAGNISDRLHHLYYFMKLNRNILMIDYRGYGQSTGSPDEEGLYLDAVASYHFLRKGLGESHSIIVYGQSLGGAVAVDLASKVTNIRALVIESTFTSMKDMANALFPFLPIGSLLRTRFESERKIQAVHCPLLVLHGTVDELVPFRLGERLFKSATEPKTFYPIVGANHNDTYVVGGEGYWRMWKEFVEDLDR